MFKIGSKIIIKSFLLFGIMQVSLTAGAFPKRVILIRHAEKPDFKSEDLSPRGYERAQALTNLFSKHPELIQNAGMPTVYLSAAYVKGKSAKRCIETITPLARKFGATVQSPYLPEDDQRMAEAILTAKNLNGKTVMIAWTHTYINDLASALGAPQVEPWPSEVFDRIWVLDYSPNGQVTIRNLAQALLPGDSN